MKYRASLFTLIFVLLGLVLLAEASPALADTPTPGPTPSPLPPGYNANSSFSSMVDQNAALPWPLPVLPTFPAGTATPTLYAATANHSTNYPAQAGTATAQVGQFTAPINQIRTPVAELMGAGPTPSGGDLNTGQDPTGDGPVTFVGFASDLGDMLGTVVGTGREFAEGLLALGTYSPVLAPIMTAELVGLVLAEFIALLLVVVRVGAWVINFTIKLLTMFGSFIP